MDFKIRKTKGLQKTFSHKFHLFNLFFSAKKKTPPHGGAFPENLGTVLVAIGDGLVIPKMKEFLGRISPVQIGGSGCQRLKVEGG